MELFDNLALGFYTASTLHNLFFCLIGVLLGTLIGVLPGIGATATIAMLLPITFQLEPVSSLIMLAGIYYGAQYGGSTTAILINMPGESSSAVTAIDGYRQARCRHSLTAPSALQPVYRPSGRGSVPAPFRWRPVPPPGCSSATHSC